MLERRAFLMAAAATAAGGLSPWSAAKTPEAQPPFFTRGLPGPGQEMLKLLAGRWRTRISLYMAIGSLEHPVTSSDITTRRNWLGGGRFLQDVTSGRIGGMSYWRLGILGYDNMAARHQWVTQDGINADMMIYQGKPGSGPHFPIDMTGEFIDQGVHGEAYVGKLIGARTEMIIRSADEHVFNIYFTPPGEPERMADHNVYTRLA